jgi:alanine dehydrogenase
LSIQIGLRKEDKNIWERRVPLSPDNIGEIIDNHQLKFIVESSPNRCFPDKEFSDAGAEISTNLSSCKVILGVKEVPIAKIENDKAYFCFSHTIKGQDYNMPLLQKFIDKGCTLVDYECIKGENGRRTVFFGRFAGVAGMINTLHILGDKLELAGFEGNPFLKIKPAYKYKDTQDAKSEIGLLKEEIAAFIKSEYKNSLIFAFAGYGNVSVGAQEIFDLLFPKTITTDELKTSVRESIIYKLILKEEDLVENINNEEFVLQDYYSNPQKYKSKFTTYLSKIDVLINCIYWDEKYPRLVEKEYLRQNYSAIKMDLICDITCDIDGSVEITYKSTDSDKPAYTYLPVENKFVEGLSSKGIINIAVDNLPAELPVDSSRFFGNALSPLISELPELVSEKEFEKLQVSDSLKNAVIVYKGKLTPNFKYLQNHLNNV